MNPNYLTECEAGMDVRRNMLHEIGSLIRRFGRKEPKRHGNYWYLQIGSYCFKHDDYSFSVSMYNGNEIIKNFGLDFGGFESSLNYMDFHHALGILRGLDYLIDG